MNTSAEKATAFYTNCFDAHGHTAKGVGWFSEASQKARFYELEAATQWHGKTVCDVGCGLGDMYDVIKRRSPETQYVGIDSYEPYVLQAKRAYPSGDFRYQDLLTWEAPFLFDVVVASGVFNIRQVDHYAYMKSCLQALLTLSKGVVCFNVLKKTVDVEDLSSLFYYWDISELLGVVRNIAPAATCIQVPGLDAEKSRSDITVLINV